MAEDLLFLPGIPSGLSCQGAECELTAHSGAMSLPRTPVEVFPVAGAAPEAVLRFLNSRGTRRYGLAPGEPEEHTLRIFARGDTGTVLGLTQSTLISYAPERGIGFHQSYESLRKLGLDPEELRLLLPGVSL